MPYSEFAPALVYFTGSAHLNRSMRNLAIQMNMSLNEHALYSGVVRSVSTFFFSVALCRIKFLIFSYKLSRIVSLLPWSFDNIICPFILHFTLCSLHQRTLPCSFLLFTQLQADSINLSFFPLLLLSPVLLTTHPFFKFFGL